MGTSPRPGRAKTANRAEREGEQHEKTHFYTIGSPVSAAVPAAHRSLCLADGQGKTDESRSYKFCPVRRRCIRGAGHHWRDHHRDLVLKRTDAQESADMYGMQTEIEYDDTFLQLVDGSVMTAPGIRWSDLGRRTGGRAFYLNFVSFKGGEAWEPEVVVGSFQMKVIGTKGVSQLIPTNTLVSTQDGMAGYTVKDNSVSVIVTTDCTVTFESNGGTEVPSQTVQYGEKVKKPEDPIREGYHLEGWYRDLDRTQKWDFHKDTVKGNMTLYANWAEGVAAGSATWWIIGGVGLLAAADSAGLAGKEEGSALRPAAAQSWRPFP